MFDIPSDHTVDRVTVTAACVEEGAEPEILRDPNKKPVKLKPGLKSKPTRRRNTA